MKAIMVSILNFVGCVIAFSQGFYPLHIGNRWEYWETPPPPNYYAWTTRAVRDTTMPNDSLYTQLSYDASLGYGGFFRQSGAFVLMYDGLQQIDRLVYDFSKTTGDTVSVWYSNGDTIITTVLYDRFQNIFGHVRRQWGFYQRTLPSTFYRINEITDSIGLTYMQIEPGFSWYLRGAIIDGIQYGEITSVGPPSENAPAKYALLQNYPNPFNSSTIVRFSVPTNEYLTIDVIDFLGRRVRTLFRGISIGSFQSVLWDGKTDLGIEQASGIYLCRLQTKNYNGSIKMILLH